jgi:hypothetical protein
MISGARKVAVFPCSRFGRVGSPQAIRISGSQKISSDILINQNQIFPATTASEYPKT